MQQSVYLGSSTAMGPFPLIAVDIGNQQAKFGWFGSPWLPGHATSRLPQPERRITLPDQADWEPLASWIAESAGELGTGEETTVGFRKGTVPFSPNENWDRPPLIDSPVLSWWIGSVHRPTATRLEAWLAARRPDDRVHRLAAKDLPLRVALEEPDRVGIDRLLDAVAVNALRTPGCAAVAVDAGTAITVNGIGVDGCFRGGAILPGMASSARALHERTDLLPLVETSDLTSPPPAVGTSTTSAIRSGVFWGAVGAVRELIERFTAEVSVPTDVWITGGGGQGIADALGLSSHYVPQLTLAGIALCAVASDSPGEEGNTA